jgi:hypothetical protein
MSNNTTHAIHTVLRRNNAGVVIDAKLEDRWHYGTSTDLFTLRAPGFEEPALWHHTVQCAYKLHPLVKQLIDCSFAPDNWQLLLLEWPHVSVDDESQIAYTRSHAQAVSGRFVRTSIGRYLSRHWASCPDHIRRNWLELFRPAIYEMRDTMEGIIMGIEFGPCSCMKSSSGSIPFRSADHNALCAWQTDKSVNVAWDNHPYAVYAPEYGWRMAVRMDKSNPDRVMGRALVNVHSSAKGYVRSYKQHESEPDGYSHSDEKLEAWLENTGYTKLRQWPNGLMLRKLVHPDSSTHVLVPYIDGGANVLSDEKTHLQFDASGCYQCDNTNGRADHVSQADCLGECARCNDDVMDDDDDRIWVGPDEDIPVCGNCSRYYTHVEGSSGSYYVHDNDVLTVCHTDYDKDNLPDHIVECADGEYRSKESSDLVEVEGNWYQEDDDTVVKCADDEWRMRDDCWESAQGNWYAETETQVDVSEGTYHPDELQSIIDNA